MRHKRELILNCQLSTINCQLSKDYGTESKSKRTNAASPNEESLVPPLLHQQHQQQNSHNHIHHIPHGASKSNLDERLKQQGKGGKGEGRELLNQSNRELIPTKCLFYFFILTAHIIYLYSIFLNPSIFIFIFNPPNATFSIIHSSLFFF